MTASIFHGKSAVAEYGGTPFTNIIEWSCTITADTAESQVMNATAYGKTREVGFKGGTATVTCKYPTGDSLIAEGSTNTLQLWRSATSGDKGYSGATICTGIEVGVDMNDIETIAYSFQFTGAIENTLT